MMRSRPVAYCILALLVLAGCNTGHDTDSLANRTPAGSVQALDCLQCHNSSLSPSLDPLVTNGTGTAGKHDRHVNYLSMPCERCHTGYYWSATHMNGTFDTGNAAVLLVGFDAYNSSGTWTADTGPGTGSCSSLNCHGSDSPGWYSTGWSFPPCATCHSNPIGPRRQVMGAAGDFASNPSITSHHVSGGADPVNGQCLVCHNLSTHATGTVLLRQADTNAVIIYSSASPSSAEAFCLSCHDAGGALITFNTVSGGTPTSPFNDGSGLGQTPYRAGIEIAADWNKSFGHRQQGLTCIGSGAQNTGCHANGHGAVTVGLLSRNLQIPQPDRYRETDFAICLECHQSYANVTKEVIFGVKFTEVVSGVTITHRYDWGYGPRQDPPLRSGPTDTYKPPYDLSGGIQTRFRDQNYDGATGKFYDDPTWFFGDFFNLHWLHIGSQAWDYRGTTASGFSCTACHSVHGSNTQQGMVYDQMQYTVYSAGSDSFGTMLGDLHRLDQYPTYCAVNCHGAFQDFYGPTYNWYEPANE